MGFKKTIWSFTSHSKTSSRTTVVLKKNEHGISDSQEPNFGGFRGIKVKIPNQTYSLLASFYCRNTEPKKNALHSNLSDSFSPKIRWESSSLDQNDGKTLFCLSFQKMELTEIDGFEMQEMSHRAHIVKSVHSKS